VASAAPRKTVIVKIQQSTNIQSLINRKGLKVNKTVSTPTGVLLVVEENAAEKVRDKVRGEPGVAWVEDETFFTLDNGETVLPLDNGETVLPLGMTVVPLDNGETVLPLDNGETVLPLDNGETVLPLETYLKIKAYYDRAARMLTPSKLLLIQTPLLKIGLYEAGLKATGKGVIIADLDTGVDSCHPALAGVFQLSFVDEVNIPENCATAATVHVPGFGHGTAVGSLLRVVAPEATLWSLRVFDSSGTAKVSDIYEAIVYATNHGVKVINMSFGATEPSSTLSEAIQYAYDRGVIMVAAGGNLGTDRLMYPAADAGVKGVVAVTNLDVKALFSNYSRSATVSAPGARIWVAYPNRSLSLTSGTSYASPLAAAEAALVLDAFSRVHRPAPTRRDTDLAVNYGVQFIDWFNPISYWGKLGHGRIYIPTALFWTGLH
jgi:subtilisin family serine protease